MLKNRVGAKTNVAEARREPGAVVLQTCPADLRVHEDRTAREAAAQKFGI